MVRSLAKSFLFVLASCSNAGDHAAWQSSYTASECAELTSIKAIEERCGDGDFDRAMEAMATDVTNACPILRRSKSKASG
jgi:hypothetical protein